MLILMILPFSNFLYKSYPIGYIFRTVWSETVHVFSYDLKVAAHEIIPFSIELKSWAMEMK